MNTNFLNTAGVQGVFDALEGIPDGKVDADGNPTFHEAMIAGGAVRNALLNKPINDVDFATTARPDQVVEAGKQAGFAVLPVGIEHGTVILNDRIEGNFEVTTLRSDIKCDGRHAVVDFTAADNKDWEGDANRRDFTINAMFMDREGRIHDYVGGLTDVNDKRLRFVGDATGRIQEDYLRILRFFRFLPIFDDVSAADPEALDAIVANRHGITGLSSERIGAEFLKILKNPNSNAVLRLMRSKKILELVLPDTNINLMSHEAMVDLAGVHPNASTDMMLLTALLDVNEAGLEKGAVRLKINNKRKNLVRGAISMADALKHPSNGQTTAQQTDHDVRVLLFRFGRDACINGVLLAWVRAGAGPNDTDWRNLLKRVEEFDRPEFQVNGTDLMDLGMPAGKGLGDKLAELTQAWMDSDFQMSKADLLATVKV